MKIPKALIYAGVTKFASGISLHTELELTHYTSSGLLSRLGNARQTELAFQTARSVTLEASNVVLTSRATAILYIEKARGFLKPHLGERWSTRWTQTGFINNSLVIPKNTPKVVNLLRTLQTYLTNHPTQQNAGAGVTPAATGALVTAMEAGQTALNNAKSGQRTKRDARDNVHKTLLEDMRGSRNEVEAVLPENDPRWLDFIERVPGDLRAPEAVTELVAQPGAPGHVRLSFLPSLRAQRYGVEVSLDAGVTFADHVTVHDTVADLIFTPGATVRIRLRARNAAGESGPSPVVEVLVPVAAAA